MPIDPGDVIVGLLADGPRAELAQRLVRYFIRAWRDPTTGQALQAMLRRAVADDDSAALLRNLAENVLLARAADALGVPIMRFATAIAQLVGIALAATILRIEPLASAAEDELVELIAPAIRRYLG